MWNVLDRHETRCLLKSLRKFKKPFFTEHILPLTDCPRVGSFVSCSPAVKPRPGSWYLLPAFRTVRPIASHGPRRGPGRGPHGRPCDTWRDVRRAAGVPPRPRSLSSVFSRVEGDSLVVRFFNGSFFCAKLNSFQASIF